MLQKWDAMGNIESDTALLKDCEFVNFNSILLINDVSVKNKNLHVAPNSIVKKINLINLQNKEPQRITRNGVLCADI